MIGWYVVETFEKKVSPGNILEKSESRNSFVAACLPYFKRSSHQEETEIYFPEKFYQVNI